MSKEIKPALFKTNNTIKSTDIEKYLNIPDFAISYNYAFWESMPAAYLYGNDETYYLIELVIDENTISNLKEVSNDLNIHIESKLINAVEYCINNNIEWLQIMIL